ncbi:hypothetical protein KBK24_0126550 [Burkholderia sp. K24]|nr:hypothetical protein KBK24_0126550 [Burkholderia sp. K24]
MLRIAWESLSAKAGAGFEDGGPLRQPAEMSAPQGASSDKTKLTETIRPDTRQRVKSALRVASSGER